MKESDERTTPIEFFNKLNSVFHFQLDAAATEANALCSKYYTIETNGLTSPWSDSTFCNPPYSRGSLKLWVIKAYEEKKLGHKSVLLLPGDISPKWYEYTRDYADTLYSLNGRLKFNGNKDLAKFGTILALFGEYHIQILAELKRIIPGFAYNNSLDDRLHRILHFEVIFPT